MGDYLGVFAENGKDVTKRVVKALKFDVDEVFCLVKLSGVFVLFVELFVMFMMVGDVIVWYVDVLMFFRK